MCWNAFHRTTRGAQSISFNSASWNNKIIHVHQSFYLMTKDEIFIQSKWRIPVVPPCLLHALPHLWQHLEIFFVLQLSLRPNPRTKCGHQEAESAVSESDPCQEGVQRASPNEMCQSQKCKYANLLGCNLMLKCVMMLSCEYHSDLWCLVSTDHRPIKCIYTTKIIRGVPRCVSDVCLSSLSNIYCVSLMKLNDSLLCVCVCALNDSHVHMQLSGTWWWSWWMPTCARSFRWSWTMSGCLICSIRCCVVSNTSTLPASFTGWASVGPQGQHGPVPGARVLHDTKVQTVNWHTIRWGV